MNEYKKLFSSYLERLEILCKKCPLYDTIEEQIMLCRNLKQELYGMISLLWEMRIINYEEYLIERERIDTTFYINPKVGRRKSDERKNQEVFRKQ